MTSSFCTHCGATLYPDSHFCAECGHSVYSAPAIKQTDYVDVRPRSSTQLVYAQQAYEQPEHATAGLSTAASEVYPPSPEAQAPMPSYVADRKNPGAAAVLSFFWAGLGQIYNGQIAKGIGFMVLYAFSVLLCFVLIGFIILPIVWIIGMWDAYNTAKQYNEKQLQNDRFYDDSLGQ